MQENRKRQQSQLQVFEGFVLHQTWRNTQHTKKCCISSAPKNIPNIWSKTVQNQGEEEVKTIISRWLQDLQNAASREKTFHAGRQKPAAHVTMCRNQARRLRERTHARLLAQLPASSVSRNPSVENSDRSEWSQCQATKTGENEQRNA